MDRYFGRPLSSTPGKPSSGATYQSLFTSTPVTPGLPIFPHATPTPYRMPGRGRSYLYDSPGPSRQSLLPSTSRQSGYQGSVTRMTHVEIHPDYVGLENELESMKTQLDRLQEQGRLLSQPYMTPPIPSHENLYPLQNHPSFLGETSNLRPRDAASEIAKISKEVDNIKENLRNLNRTKYTRETRIPSSAGLHSSTSGTTEVSKSYIALEHEVKQLKEHMDRLEQKSKAAEESYQNFAPALPEEHSAESWLKYLETRNSSREMGTRNNLQEIKRRISSSKGHMLDDSHPRTLVGRSDDIPDIDLNEVKQQIKTKMREEQESEMELLEVMRLNKDKLISELDVCTDYMRRTQLMLDRCNEELQLLEDEKRELKTGVEYQKDPQSTLDERHLEVIRRTNTLVATIELLKKTLKQQQELAERETKEKIYTDTMEAIVSARKRLAESSPSSSEITSPTRSVSPASDQKEKQAEGYEEPEGEDKSGKEKSLIKGRSASSIIAEMGLNKTQSDLLLRWLKAERSSSPEASRVELSEKKTDSDLLLKWIKDKEERSKEQYEEPVKSDIIQKETTVKLEDKPGEKTGKQKGEISEMVIKREAKEQLQEGVKKEVFMEDLKQDKMEKPMEPVKKESLPKKELYPEQKPEKPTTKTDEAESMGFFMKLLQRTQTQSDQVLQSISAMSHARSRTEFPEASLRDIILHTSSDKLGPSSREVIKRSLEEARQRTRKAKESFEEIKTSSIILVESFEDVKALTEEKQKTSILLEDLERILKNPPRMPTLEEEEENVEFECFNFAKWFRIHYPKRPPSKSIGVQCYSQDSDMDIELSVSSQHGEETGGKLVQPFDLGKWLRKLYPHKPKVKTTIGLQCNVHHSEEDCLFHKECRIHQLHRVFSPHLGLVRSDQQAERKSLTQNESTNSV